MEPIELLASGLDVSGLAAWIESIPWTEWPQQSLTRLQPAMVTDPEWHGFAKRTDDLVEHLRAAMAERTPGAYFTKNRWLSVVMPGDEIDPHRDAPEPDWVRRVHVPLLTNDRALFVAEETPYHLAVGSAYLIDKTALHAVTNAGETPRVHLMFELMSATKRD